MAKETLEEQCAEQARYFISEAKLTAHQCELVMFALSTHAPAVMSELATHSGTAEMRLTIKFDDEWRPFVDQHSRTVRLHRYPGFGTAREVHSPQNDKWYHECWVE